MKVSQIVVGAARTINLGNYESLKLEGSCTIDFDDNDYMIGEEYYLPESRKKAIAEVKRQMQEAYESFKPKGK